MIMSLGQPDPCRLLDKDAGTKTYFYRAEDVFDFAWTCSPDYLVKEGQWKDVSIRLLIQPEHESLSERYISSAKKCTGIF